MSKRVEPKEKRYFLLTAGGSYQGTRAEVRRRINELKGGIRLLSSVPEKLGEREVILIKGDVVILDKKQQALLDAVAKLWPRYRYPRLPRHPLIDVIVRFANSLEQRTGGRARAKLTASTYEPGVVSFIIESIPHSLSVARMSTCRFSLRIDGDRLHVVREEGEKRWPPLTRENIIEFLKAVSRSRDTRVAVLDCMRFALDEDSR